MEQRPVRAFCSYEMKKKSLAGMGGGSIQAQPVQPWEAQPGVQIFLELVHQWSGHM